MELIRCDYCGNETQEEHSPPGWRHIQNVSPFTLMGEVDDFHTCSWACLTSYAEERKNNGGR